MAIAAAIIGAGASLYANKKTNDANQEIASDTNAYNERTRADTIRLVEKAIADARGQVTDSYDKSQNVRQQAFLGGQDIMGQAFKPAGKAFLDGNFMAQEALSGSLPMRNNAILGKEIDYSALEPRRIPVDMKELEFLANPNLKLPFQQFQSSPQAGGQSSASAQGGEPQPTGYDDYGWMREMMLRDPYMRTR